MSVIRRRKDAVDALEHAMRGVQTYEPYRIENRSSESGLIGTRSAARVRILDDTPVEHEVTVVMRRRSHKVRGR